MPGQVGLRRRADWLWLWRGHDEHFGPAVLHPDGRLNRPALAAKVFTNPDELAVLNRITHPLIDRMIQERAAQLAEQDVVAIIDRPLLDAELAARYGVAGIIVVDTPEDVAVARLMEQRGFGEEDARARVAAQISREERRRFASFVLDNGANRETLELRLDDLWVWIEGERARLR